tara:strand:+ start:1189 stop:1371 length:183 start_codon:yes stop_codon:yes gene_type:complete
MKNEKLIQRLSVSLGVTPELYRVWRSRKSVPVAYHLEMYKAAHAIGIELLDEDFVWSDDE